MAGSMQAPGGHSAVLVDDEAHLSEYLQRKLAQLWPQLEIAGTAVNGRQALALIRQTQPDIVFLDIHMPGLSGLQVAEALPADTKIVFVTAYDEYAVQAFERAAVDYLLKPVSDARLQQTIDKLTREQRDQAGDVRALLRELAAPQTQYLQWIRAGLGETTELVAVADVVYFQADSKYTNVVTVDREYVIRMSIKELEQELDPNQFWRVHRGTVVRVDRIASARRDLRGRYELTLRGCAHTLRTSQAYGHLFKQM